MTTARDRCLLCSLDRVAVWVRRPNGSQLETCERCAEELIACHGYTWGGYL